MSYRTARLVLESAEVQVPVEVDQQYNIVTAMDGVDIQPGTMVNVIKVTDKQIEFKVVDTESTYSTDYDTFVTHCQLQSNNVNEGYLDKLSDSKVKDVAIEIGLYPDKAMYDKKSAKELRDELSNELDADKDKYQDLIARIVKECDESFVNEALSPADTTRLTAIINNTYAMVNYAHVLHNNDFDAPNVNAVHLALETLYTELPALADELGEACRFDYDITLDHTVVINEANPVKACFDLRNDLLSLQKDMPGYINSMIDAINGLLTSVMYKMVRLGGLAKPAIEVVTEAAARGWSEYSVQEKLNALKLAIMSDGLAYDAEDYVGKDLKDMPKELQAALEIVTAVNESADNDKIAANVWASYSNDERKRIAKLAGRESDINADWQKMVSDVQSDLKRVMVSDGDLKEDECDESEVQDAYREFFRNKLEEFGVKSPAELSEDQKKDFFNQIKAEWPDAKEEMLNESVSNMVGTIFANYFAKAEDKKKSQVADMLDIEKTATPEQIAKAFDAATSNDQETCCKILSIDESKESDEANKVAFARAYADCNDIKKIQKIDEILLKAGQRVSTSIDVAFAAMKPEIQKQLCSTLGIDWMNESKSNVNLNRKRSIIAALKYVNEELEVGAELKCLKDLVTTDGAVIPAESTVSYTGIDSNTNVATVTFGENSYAVTIPDLTAATQQMGPAI